MEKFYIRFFENRIIFEIIAKTFDVGIWEVLYYSFPEKEFMGTILAF